MAKKNVLKATTNAELLSYIINETPELREEIDLPVQGESTKPLGQLIVDNNRYKNAFINTVNIIGLTIIKRNLWENPWEIFANRGTLRRGQQIRELIIDLAKVYDYNENYSNKAKFLDTEVPDVYQYMHELNFQKWYETTVNESELLMAFDNEDDGLLTFITNQIANLYETYKYDKYQVDKYQLCRRMLEGTIPVKQIVDYASKSPRDILAEMKGVSNMMTFKKPNFNPAGIRKATPFNEQYLILDAEREAINTTNVLATSYFKDEADVKTNMALTDSFYDFDVPRLKELLKDAFVEFTSDEINQLKTVIGVIISEKWFMDYFYALDNNPEGKKQTEWVNPTTLDRNVFLHVWLVLSTSPFENCCVFTTETPEVKSVTVSPSTATVTAGQTVKLTATVVTEGFANKAVAWSSSDETVKVNSRGEVFIPADATSETEITITATSIYDNSVTGTATITVA